MVTMIGTQREEVARRQKDRETGKQNNAQPNGQGQRKCTDGQRHTQNTETNRQIDRKTERQAEKHRDTRADS